MAVAVMAGLAHDRDDLIDRRRVGGVALALVTRRDPCAEARHGRRRAATSGSVKQRLNRHGSLVCESWTITRQLYTPHALAAQETSSELKAMRVARSGRLACRIAERRFPRREIG